MTKSNTPKLIEDYLDNILDEKQSREFEDRLKNDPGFRQDYEHWLEMRKSVKEELEHHKREEDLRKTLNELSQQHFPDKSRAKVFWIGVVAAAAVILFVLVFQFVFRTQDVYHAHKLIPNAEFTVLDASAPVLIANAERAFNAGNFEEAASALSDLRQAEPDNPLYDMYYAVSKLEIGETGEAIPIFRELSQSQTLLRDDAKYFLGLSFLRQEEMDSTRHYLTQIPEGNYYFQSSQEILEEIN